MEKRKRAGKLFGSPNIKNVQVSGREAWSAKSEQIARSVAAVLRSLPDWRSRTRREVAEEMNRRGLLTGRDLSWTASLLRGPLQRAEELLTGDDEAMRKHPTCGLF